MEKQQRITKMSDHMAFYSINIHRNLIQVVVDMKGIYKPGMIWKGPTFIPVSTTYLCLGEVKLRQFWIWRRYEVGSGRGRKMQCRKLLKLFKIWGLLVCNFTSLRRIPVNLQILSFYAPQICIGCRVYTYICCNFCSIWE